MSGCKNNLLAFAHKKFSYYYSWLFFKQQQTVEKMTIEKRAVKNKASRVQTL